MPAPGAPLTGFDGEGTEEDRRYLAQVMAEIDEEVRRRRSSGELPARIERELDELFLAFSPLSGRGAGLRDALRMVDASAFIDPVVPVASAKSGGALVKRGIRGATLWYVGWVTHQVSRFATAVSRALHLLDEQVAALRAQLEGQRVPPAPIVEVPWAHRPDAWWVPEAAAALSGVRGRVLHAAAGDGWLLGVLRDRGIDAYGVDPRRAALEPRGDLDLREEPVVDHLRAIAPAGLDGVVLTGVAESMGAGERTVLLELLGDRLAPGGVLVVHSLTRAAWEGDDLPAEADLAPGRPLRPSTWVQLLSGAGFQASVHGHPGAGDYAVVAVRDDGPIGLL
ncbi:MAG TPA: methyltransferase domain-containing protein [Acidimicrobiales bacterium]|nr:methyltransferase domain-containing protein [Acidimicrobiales bacterium]